MMFLKTSVKALSFTLLSAGLLLGAGAPKLKNDIDPVVMEPVHSDRPTEIPDMLMVKLKDAEISVKAGPDAVLENFSYPALDDLIGKLDAVRIDRAFPTKYAAKSAADRELEKFFRITFKVGSDLDEALYLLNSHPDVEYAERIPIHYTERVPNDPLYRNEIGVQQIHFTMVSAEAAWDINTGSSDIVLAVIDTGVDWNHVDLQAKIWSNPGETLDGTDSDGNGYVDDVRGWDFVNVTPAMTPAHSSEDGKIADNDPSDVDGHGTHCSGIAGASTDNSTGVAGTNWGVTIMPVRVGYLTEDGNGSIPWGYDGVVYAADNGADVLSLSWGGGSYYQSSQDIMDYAWDKGCVIIAAAGNDGSADVHYPSAYNHVMAVAATGNVSDRKADFSNYGTWVDISAPGTNLNSTYPSDSYVRLSGTSMACPLVAGAAALAWSQFPDFSNHDIVTQIAMTADNIDDVNASYIGLLGYGRINLEKMLQPAEWTPNLKLADVRIDDSAGNNNGYADPGETVDLIVDLDNAFLGGAITGVTLTIESDDYAVTVTNGSSSIGNIDALSSVSNSSVPFTFTVEGTSIAHRGKFTMTLEDDSGYSEVFEFSQILGIPSILYVDDDDGANNVEGYYFKVLDSLGLSYEYWDHLKQGTPSAATLANYAAVIWSCEWAFPSLDAADRAAVGTYLTNGGNFFLSGQDIGWDMCELSTAENEFSRSSGASKTWYETYLKAKYLMDDGSAGDVLYIGAGGVDGNPVTDGLAFNISQPGRDATNQYPSVIQVLDSSVPAVVYETGDVGATMYEGEYKLINFAFGFEAVMDLPNRMAIMTNAMKWLNSMEIEHNKVADTEAADTSIPVDITVYSDLEVDSAAVYWSLTGLPPYTITGMVPVVVDPDPPAGTYVFSAELPGQASGTTIYYFVYSQNSKGYAQTYPAGAPLNMLEFTVGPDNQSPVIHDFTEISNTIDNSGLYTIKAVISDNLGLDTRTGASEVVYRLNSGAESSARLEWQDRDDYDIYEAVIDLGGVLANGDTVTYTIKAVDASTAANYTMTDPVSFTIVSSEVLEDFEDNLSNWTYTGSWEQFFYPHSGSYSITDSPSGYYSSDIYNTLEFMKPINLSTRSEAYLTFWHFYSVHETDRVHVQATVDDGETWQDLVSFWGSQFQWTERIISLNDYIGETAVRCRFVLESDGSLESDGLYLDDIMIYVDTTMTVTSLDNSAAVPDKFEVSANYPNPFNPTTTFRYALPEMSDVSITVFNIRGEEVYSVNRAAQSPGYYEFNWSGRNAAGLSVSSGVYFYRVLAGNDMITRKMLLLK